jgi:hypothetical protein
MLRSQFAIKTLLFFFFINDVDDTGITSHILLMDY